MRSRWREPNFSGALHCGLRLPEGGLRCIVCTASILDSRSPAPVFGAAGLPVTSVVRA